MKINRFCIWFEKHFFLLTCLGVILVYLLLFITNGGHVLIPDYLDSSLIWFKLLSESGKMFSGLHVSIPNIMNGLDRNLFGTEFNVMLWLHYFFEPFTASLINQILLRLIAFTGMILLLNVHILKKKYNNSVVLVTALTFSLLPFWPGGGLSVAGQPLALYAFLNFRELRQTIKDWLIILLIPFYSSFVLSFAFFLCVISLLCLYDVIRLKKLNYSFLFAIVTMVFTYLLIDYRLLYTLFFSGSFVSHRSEWFVFRKGLGVKDAVLLSWQLLKSGHYHASSLHQYILSASALMAFSIGLAKEFKVKLLIVLLLFIGLISIFYGFWQWQGLEVIKTQFSFLTSFQFDRFYFLFPLLWYIVFALSLNIFIEYIRRYGKYIVTILIICQLLILFYEHDAIRERKNPTFKEFYSENLFQDVSNYIGKEKSTYRVVSIGLHPSISQYNGFYTLDGYMPNYPLSYKHDFREIIEKELEKDEKKKSYFDMWGNRCYIFVSEIGLNSYNSKDKNPKINRLDLNTAKLYKMGGRFVFSAVEILNSVENNLVLLKTFENRDSPWKLYLYEVSQKDE